MEDCGIQEIPRGDTDVGTEVVVRNQLDLEVETGTVIEKETDAVIGHRDAAVRRTTTVQGKKSEIVTGGEMIVVTEKHVYPGNHMGEAETEAVAWKDLSTSRVIGMTTGQKTGTEDEVGAPNTIGEEVQTEIEFDFILIGCLQSQKLGSLISALRNGLPYKR